MKTYTTLTNQFKVLSNNPTSTNVALGAQLINDALRYLTAKYFFNEVFQLFPGGTVAGQQFYQLPSDIKVIETAFITSGNIRYTMKETPDRIYWDNLNYVPYSSNVAEWYFIFNGKMGIFPIPSSSALPLTYVYKKRIVDISQPDYITGTITVTNASPTITGSGVVFNPQMVGRWVNISETVGGDGQWYQIGAFVSSTILTLLNNYNGIAASGVTYIIGECPLLPEDYQDLPLYRALKIYFTSIVPDTQRAKTYTDLYEEGFARLNAEYGAKSNTVNITRQDEEIVNPNLYLRY